MGCKVVRKLRSRTGFYAAIIEVSVPVRFYWAEDGFDGIEIGPLPVGTTSYQHRLIGHVLEAVGGKIKSPIPDVWLEAFRK